MNKNELQAQLEQSLKAKKGYDLKKLAEQAIEAFPEESFGQAYLAEAHIINYNAKEAVTIFTELLEQAPDNLHYEIRRAYALMKARDKDAAKAAYEHALSKAPDNTEALTGLAEIHLSNWKAEEALPLLNKAVELGAKDKNTYLLRAKALYENGQFDQAMADTEAASGGQFDEQAVLMKVEIFKKQDLKDKVIEQYKLLEEKLPENTVHPANHAHYLMQKEDFKAAAAQYSICIEKDQAKGWGAENHYKSRAKARVELGENEVALMDLKIVIDKDEKDGEAYRLRAKALEGMGQWQAAVEALNLALEEENGFHRPQLLIDRGNLLLKLKKWDEASKDFQELIDSGNRFYEKDGYYGLGCAAHGNGDLKAAYKHWQAAANMHHPEAHQAIEKYCAAVKDEATSAAEKELEAEFADAFEENAQSPFLQQIFGKFWRIDKDTTVENAPALQKIPEKMREMVMATLEQLAFTISNKGLFFINPFKDDIRAFYRILKEDENGVTISGKPINGKPPKDIQMNLENGQLVLSGLSPDGTKFYFNAKAAEEMDEEDKAQFKEKMKSIAMEFLGDMASKLKDAFSK
jgi:tetratricopeptide (TPR) repeat protein